MITYWTRKCNSVLKTAGAKTQEAVEAKGDPEVTDMASRQAISPMGSTWERT